jgi:hypothetical protein
MTATGVVAAAATESKTIKTNDLKRFAMIKNLFVGLSILLGTTLAQAREMPEMRKVASYHPTFSYDIGASTGSENGNSYSELNLALNWYWTDWLNWRNALFTRFGSNVTSVSGLDSSFLASYDLSTDDGTFGVKAFAGPGVRFASANNNAALAEAGIIFKLGGIQLGGGARYLSYFNTREDKYNVELPKNETQYFIVLAGGGAF